MRLDDLSRDGIRFGFMFVDHAHTYEAVKAACERMPSVLRPGAFIAFHDFFGRNFGVYPAARDTLANARFPFYGLCGCMGVYRHETV
jgi:hypothetical protein